MATDPPLPKLAANVRGGLKAALLATLPAILTPLFLVTEVPAHSSASEARFEGLKRTKPRHLRSLLDECLEEQGAADLASVDLPGLDQCLINSELFSSVKSGIEEVLVIRVKERWTLIPLPFFRSQEDSTDVGGFLIESNFLGRGQLLVPGGTFGSLGNSSFAMLRDPSVAYSDWTSRAMYLRDFGDIFRYEGEVKVDGYHQREEAFSLSPGYQFTADLEGRAVLGYTVRDYEEAESLGAPPENYRFWSAGLGIELDATDYKFYYSEGHRVRAEIRQQFARSGEGNPTLSGEAVWDWQGPFPGRSILKLSVEGMAVDSDAAVDSFQVGGEKSLRGFRTRVCGPGTWPGPSSTTTSPSGKGPSAPGRRGPFSPMHSTGPRKAPTRADGRTPWPTGRASSST